MTQHVVEEIKAALVRLDDRRFAASIESVFNYSEFVSKSVFRYPRLVTNLINSGDLQRGYIAEFLINKIYQLTDKIQTPEQLDQCLREIRVIETIRIAWRELAGVTDVEQSMLDLSFLADALVNVAMAKHLQWLSQRFGQPVSEANGQSAGFVVFAMGKLGGEELNFSSDIDLIFAYSDNGYTNGKKSISNNEFFLKLGQSLINTLNDATTAEFVYRVDMRLRPNGESGPLVMSFAAMENYYQIHGREWERYAWIKARVIAGDESKGADFLSQLRPFVYRKYLDYQVYDSLQEMKELINREIRQHGLKNNIKLGRGGIREIEFITQSHQLVRGGRDPQLRTRSLKKALTTLAEQNLIDPGIVAQLYDAYLFLRAVEHRLQMKNDQQTHLLPVNTNERSQLAASFGIGLEEFEQKLDKVRDFVHTEFVKLHRDKNVGQVEDKWQLIWQNLLAISESGLVTEDSELTATLKSYVNSKSYRALESKARRVVERLIPKMLRLVAQTNQPVQSLNRVLDIITSIGSRTAYLSLLDQFPIACQQLVELSASSAWVGRWVAQHPIVLDTLINPRTDQYIFNDGELRWRISQQIDQESDAELKHDILRQVHHSSLLQIAIAELQQQYPVNKIREFISNTAEIIVNCVIGLCQHELETKFGLPVCSNNNNSDYFGVIAYGKLGSKELSYHADLDLVFVYDDEVLCANTQGGAKSVRIDYYFSRLVQRIITMLGMQTAIGKLYDVDTRLRPSGQSGLLVSSLSQYRKYQTIHAWTWEHQALVKARMISDTPVLNKKFEQIRTMVLTKPRSQATLQKEIVSMRERMREAVNLNTDFSVKTDSGGMVDIEFICQYLVLLHASSTEELCLQRGVIGILSLLEHAGIIKQKYANKLTTTYTLLLEYENRQKLQHTNDGDYEHLKSKMKQTRKFWDRLFA